MDITLEQINSLWKSYEPLHAAMRRRRRYYHGDSDINARNARYASGTKKANVPTNWAGYCVDMYVGAMTDQPYQLAMNADDGPDTLDVYDVVRDDADLDSADSEVLRNALICGYGLELHEYTDAKIRVLVEKPENWALLRDENETILLAVTRFTVPSGGVFRGEILADAIDVQYVYDATKRTAYRRKHSQAGNGAWEEIESTPHYYGAVPVVETAINDERKPLLSDALLKQIDEYEEIDSLSGDDIRNTSDAVLVLKGIDAQWVKDNEDLITNKRILPIAEDAHAEYLTRITDTERIADRLNRTREAIHIMANVPDVQQIVGATGGTSGIALQLKFMPMQHRAGTFAKFVAKGVRARVDLINSMVRKVQQVAIENYKVIIGFSMPINRIEEWQNIGALQGIVSHKTQLELLSDIDDPDQELKNLEADMTRDAELRTLTEGPEVQAARQDVQVQRTMPQVDATINDAIALIGDRVLAAVTRAGGVA